MKRYQSLDVFVNQARLYELLIDGMANGITNLHPHYSRELIDMVIDDDITQDLNAHPITATFKRRDEAGKEKIETIKAKFVVGSGEARSSVRKSLDVSLQGDSANKAWGVMDILLNTDFPDIRVKSFIQSKDHGAVMTIPREGGYLCRFYVELDMIDKDKRASDLNLSEQDLIAQAQKNFHPYTLDVKEVAWWSIYSVGQRFHLAQATRVADGMSQHLGYLVKADGRWKIFLFGGAQNPTEISSSVYQFVDFLANDASSPVLKYPPKGADVDSAIDTYAVFQQQGLSMRHQSRRWLCFDRQARSTHRVGPACDRT